MSTCITPVHNVANIECIAVCTSVSCHPVDLPAPWLFLFNVPCAYECQSARFKKVMQAYTRYVEYDRSATQTLRASPTNEYQIYNIGWRFGTFTQPLHMRPRASLESVATPRSLCRTDILLRSGVPRRLARITCSTLNVPNEYKLPLAIVLSAPSPRA